MSREEMNDEVHEKIAVCSLCVVMLLSVATIIYADVTYNTLDLEMQPYGGKDASASVRKERTQDNALIIVNSYEFEPQKYLIGRVRRQAGDAAATSEFKITHLGGYNQTYLSGYGKVGEFYYFRAQTDNTSAYSGKLNGRWAP